MATCAVSIPFKWANLDPASTIDVFVDVSNQFFGTAVSTAASAASQPLRTSDLDLPTIPLPAPGTTTQLAFDIRM